MKLLKDSARIENGICWTKEMEKCWNFSFLFIFVFPECFHFSFPNDIVPHLPAAHLPKHHQSKHALCLWQQRGSSQELFECCGTCWGGLTSHAGHPEPLQAAQSRRRIKPEVNLDCLGEQRCTFLQQNFTQLQQSQPSISSQHSRQGL